MEIQNKLSNAYYINLINLAQGLSNDGSNFKNTISSIIDLIKQQKNNSSLEQQELLMAYDDFNTIKEHWNKYAKQASTISLMGFRNAMMLGQTSMQEVSNSIVLSTVHTMKGQQSLIVFLVGMDDLTFPDYRAVNNEEMLSQERNNLYVAVTRAQRYLFISYPTERIMPWGDKMRRDRSRLLPAQTLSTM